MKIPVLDLGPIHDPIAAEIDAAIARVVASRTFIQGPEVRALEAEVEAFLGGGVTAVGCGNGSDAIVLALRAFDIGPGDEVIVPSFTFVSSGSSVALAGATPVFCDVSAATFNLDIDDVVARLTPRTRAVVAVHLFGRPADVHALRARLDDLGRDEIVIIEDAAQSLGAFLDGAPVGTLADAATFSFFPSKNLGCFGDGGMVAMRDPDAAERVRMLSQHGSRVKYQNELLGQNSRLDALQAAILRVKLPHLRAWCDERRRLAARYRERLGAAEALGAVLPADDGEGGRFGQIWNQFTLRVPRRDAVRDRLEAIGIGSMVYYPRTLASQPCFAHLAQAPPPVAERLTNEVLSIPVYPGLTESMQDAVVDGLVATLRDLAT